MDDYRIKRATGHRIWDRGRGSCRQSACNPSTSSFFRSINPLQPTSTLWMSPLPAGTSSTGAGRQSLARSPCTSPTPTAWRSLGRLCSRHGRDRPLGHCRVSCGCSRAIQHHASEPWHHGVAWMFPVATLPGSNDFKGCLGHSFRKLTHCSTPGPELTEGDNPCAGGPQGISRSRINSRSSTASGTHAATDAPSADWSCLTFPARTPEVIGIGLTEVKSHDNRQFECNSKRRISLPQVQIRRESGLCDLGAR